ncbi:MAG: hypothetical protein JWQ30_794, partial [Sediminibacterium sp.]|nr:hypothetical protein [Sediminibacterium sp.]
GGFFMCEGISRKGAKEQRRQGGRRDCVFTITDEILWINFELRI